MMHETTCDLATQQRIHVVGVGGPGMSAIATTLQQMGHLVSGSDIKNSLTIERLQALGVRINIGHSVAVVEHCDYVTASSAIPQNNIEIVAARSAGTMVLSRAELEAIAHVLRRHPQVLVVCDEIYEFLLAPGHTHHSFAAVAPDLADRIFTVNGFAKGWAMTGWRIGWLAGAQEVIGAASALQSQTTSNVCTFAQFGALAAISGSRQCVHAMAAEFNGRRSLLTEGLMAMEGLKLMAPEGAFYAFPDVSHFGLDSMTLCNRLLDEVGLAVVPGVAFGDDRCIRLSCAASPATIEDGLERLQRFLGSL